MADKEKPRSLKQARKAGADDLTVISGNWPENSRPAQYYGNFPLRPNR